MISLSIKNLILIESAEVHFGGGLNIITGETGSGKSALLHALRLISGERADSSCIRQGAQIAVVEALAKPDLLIRREIHRSGKNRCFINDELSTIAELKELNLIEMLDQNSAISLFENQKQLLDAFAKTENDTKAYYALTSEIKAIEKQLEELLKIPKDRELEWAKKDLDWMEECGWSPREEEAISQEHSNMCKTEEITQKCSLLAELFDTHIPPLKRASTLLEQLSKMDSAILAHIEQVKAALLELQDAAHTVQGRLDRQELSPDRIAYLEQKLSDFTQLKKRFGTDIAAHKQKLLDTIDHLSNLDEKIQELTAQKENLTQKAKQTETHILQERKAKAPLLSKLVQEEIRSLNIPHALFSIEVGDALQEVSFLFSANPGVSLTSIDTCASGGEISRLFLAIKTVLSEGSSMLVFDEIDSNVGGETSRILGEKLKALATKRQLVCVTHFVQVASKASDHFLVSKQQLENHSYTHIKKLNDNERQTEYRRMLGSA